VNRRHLVDEAATIAFGRECGESAKEGETFALVGDLGAGKTHFCKGFAEGLGYNGDVASPTFSLVHEYRSCRLPLFHFDFYRLESADELLALGWDEYLDEGGVIVAEWADKYPELLPANTRWLRFTLAADGSRVVASE
jgi:tRNA threonylcarbamoyladenosine biosynthesis protein TsaE